MKIRDIISEAPGSYQQAYDAAKSIFSPAKAITNDPAYQAGYNKTKNIFSPTKWGKSDDAANASTAQPKDFEIKDSLNNAAAGKVYQDDVKVLQQVHTGVKSGKIKPNVDAAALLPVLQAAYQTQPISDDSKKLLAQFAQQF
jgi:cytochrome c1